MDKIKNYEKFNPQIHKSTNCFKRYNLYKYRSALSVFFVVIFLMNRSYSQNYNYLVRIPSVDKEVHANQVTIDYRSSGTGRSEVRMGMGNVVYFGNTTSAVCSFDPTSYPGTIIDASPNGSGQIVIKCSKSTDVCFTICNMIVEEEPVVYQNDVYVYETSTLYRGNDLEITSNSGELQFKLSQCNNTIENYPPPIMLPCDGVHSFCGDFGGISQYGDSYIITCIPSFSLCVFVNVHNGPDISCD